MRPRSALEGPCGVTGWSLDVPAGVFGSSERLLGSLRASQAVLGIPCGVAVWSLDIPHSRKTSNP